ncbi:MAG: ADP-ribosylglycohydrolase family protein [Lachnospiraceae bacterium]|nr:ADP-ribosylglycohydrolase family protein [Lachnospiraceae bacterium]
MPSFRDGCAVFAEYATPEEEINSSGYVLDSLEAAVWCLITTDTYADCVLKAVNLGLDTDTTAAIAGGLAGLYYGRDSIPEEWLHTIREGKTLPQNLVEI